MLVVSIGVFVLAGAMRLARFNLATSKPRTGWFAGIPITVAGGGLISTTEDLNRFLRAFVGNQIFRESTTWDEMFEWVDSGPFHGYGFGVGLVDFERSDNPAHAGLGPVWGHGGSSQNFMYYWPSQDITMIGTLNQIDAEMSLYDIVASVMTTVRDTLEGS